VGHLEEALGATPVLGFDRMIDAGDARVGSQRIAGFAERHDLREWLLPLSAQWGLVWRTQPVPLQHAGHIAILLSLGFGNGSPLPQPSGQFDIYVNERYALSCRVVNHSQVWRREECALAFAANRCETAAPYAGMTLSSLIVDEAQATFGPALLVVPAAWVLAGAPITVAVKTHCHTQSTRWLQLESTPGLLDSTDLYRAVALLAGPRPKASGYPLFFGDIHTHSGQVLEACDNSGCGLGTRADNYAYARGPGGLDFYALTDHEWQIDPQNPAGYLDLADRYQSDGSFVCLPGYEFTNLLWGHRNVYFGDSGGVVVNTNRTPGGRPTKDPAQCIAPPELWRALAAHKVPFLTVPHHPSAASHPFTWDVFDPRYDRLVEVYSCWGSSAYTGDFPRGVSDRYPSLDIHKALARGLRFGLIASADGHDGHPGNAQGPLVKHHHQFHFCGSGRAVVLAEALTRQAVYEALYQRRCYATTGVPIVLDVSLNGGLMGQELPALPLGSRPRLAVRCQGSNGLEQIRVVKNGRVAYAEPCFGARDADLVWGDAHYQRDEPSSYHVRVVQVDRESAWSSPIWVG
jgi:hypothetical protein